MKEAQKKYDLQELTPAKENTFREVILDIGKEDYKIKTIVSKSSLTVGVELYYNIYCFVEQRVKDFFLDILESATAAPQKVPTGLNAFQRELTGIAGQLLRIVSHNSTVFCIYYYDVIAAALPKSSEAN